MRLLIIEDEKHAADRLAEMISVLKPELGTPDFADSVESGIARLKGSQYDLIFTDIQLGDGTCFDLFSQVPPAAPVIFITAYDEHALKAFQVNAVDYLLKPLKREELLRALEKAVARIPGGQGIDYSQLAKAILEEEKKFDRRYLIRFADQMRTISSEEIAYIYTVQKSVFLVLDNGREYPIDKSLDHLEKELDPRKFFRINRQFIVTLKCIKGMHPASKSRVQLDLNPPHKGEVIVSTERSPLFKSWLAQK